MRIDIIDGKPYLELPCVPGTTVYTVAPYISLNAASLPFKSELQIVEEKYELDDILRNLKDFGTTVFATLREAEIRKAKLEEAMKR